ncbi:DDE-type integrase/transposase/recombinase [Rhizophagus irregularis DAOM 181602=DAOM 197198]|nr:DDE-type integrase/transposase/recombinase [Rhizophagus irregularis DAOM 181602=DAOM 197198]
MVELLTIKFEIKHNLSMNYHPQTNGLVERFNKTLCESLAKLQEDKQWDDKIPLYMEDTFQRNIAKEEILRFQMR